VPTYEYVCTACGNNLEVVQRFTDESLTECPVCHGRLRKMFYPVGVVFKGSGFYRTDSRTQDKEPAAAGSTNGSAGTKADDAVKTVEKTGGGDGAKTGSGRKGESGAKKAASTPAA
jgi:putative FmdB family regulatory protein